MTKLAVPNLSRLRYPPNGQPDVWGATGSNVGTSFPAGTGGVFGAWTQLQNGYGLPTIMWGLTLQGSTGAAARFQIGIGASGAEAVVYDTGVYLYIVGEDEYPIIPNLLIPANTRVAARYAPQSTGAGAIIAAFQLTVVV